jgi:CheY-like chemotaxis protein
MSTSQREMLIRALPYVRRYARALCGSQTRGDPLVTEGLRAVLAADEAPDDPRLALYAEVTRLFDVATRDAAGDATRDTTGVAGAAGAPVHGSEAKQRQLLLLTSLEGMPVERAAPVVGLGAEDAAAMLTSARERLRAAAATDILIIEDEPIIAMDIEELVQGCGHRVVGTASSEREAVEIARRTRPGLILADINLGAGGDGAHAVSRIMQIHAAPVIFVTAYPERLLTGEEIEPAFVITKPFEPMTLAVATYQAVTGGVQLD